jgi:hypothetical protein
MVIPVMLFQGHEIRRTLAKRKTDSKEAFDFILFFKWSYAEPTKIGLIFMKDGFR